MSKKTLPSTENDVTDESIFNHRRTLIKAALASSASMLISTPSYAKLYSHIAKDSNPEALDITDLNDVSHYTNYYEFTGNKHDATTLAQPLLIDPWSVEIEGEAEKTGVYTLEDILKNNPLEERIYRFRCVEGWSMVVPWIGFSLANLIKQFKPTSNANYVEFTSLHDPKVMKTKLLNWPYIEALRIDEATHPLSFMATGMYNDSLPKQNGAPLRLVIPWKYGFKSIKAIVKIRFTEKIPTTTWNQSVPQEYGFYANVNPHVPHPRWSQSRERILGANIFTPKQKTAIFNGYGDQVAALYSGMDLKKFF